MPRPIPTADPVDVYVGERLRAERLRKGLSQTELGRALGISFQQIQKYERGVNRVSASMLVRAANALAITVADLFPSDDRALRSDRLEIGAIRGGDRLARHFSSMSPANRTLLLEIAERFATSSEQ